MAEEIRSELRSGNVSRALAAIEKEPDSAYAVLEDLREDCAEAPANVLKDAEAFDEVIANASCFSTDLTEREILQCSVRFVVWRAARLLGLSSDARRWQSEYKKIFQCSVSWEMADSLYEGGANTDGVVSVDESLNALDDEGIFQLLLYISERAEDSPEHVGHLAIALHRVLSNPSRWRAADLRALLLGMSARIAAGAARATSSPESALRWLAIAEENLRTDSDGAAELARTAFLRLTVFYNMSRFDVVLERISDLVQTLEELELWADVAKCRILWAASLKLCGRLREARNALAPILSRRDEIGPALYGWILAESGDQQALMGESGEAFGSLREATAIFSETNQITGLAFVSAVQGYIHMRTGRPADAIEDFRRSQQIYGALGMKAYEGYYRLLVADGLLLMGYPADAEKEVVGALPVLEEGGLVAEAAAGVSLLREAVRRRKLSVELLRETRATLKLRGY